MIASVAIDSPLPNLDRLFDYEVPDELAGVAVVGARVKIPFGRTKNGVDGFIVELGTESSYVGKLGEITSVVSPVPVLPRSSYDLLRAVADRQAAAVGDLLKLAVPSRSVNVEKKFHSEALGYGVPRKRTAGKISAKLSKPVGDHWAENLIEFAQKQIAAGYSAILLVPDFRDQRVLKQLADSMGIEYIDYSTDRKGSERYQSFLSCLRPGNHIVIGSRNAVYAPLSNLGGICIYDDADDNLVEPTSPYVHARDVALVRQKLSNCELLFVANYRSTEIERLIEIGFAEDIPDDFRTPQVAVSEEIAKLPTMAWQAIRESINDRNSAVLIQVSSKGVARSTYCWDCQERAKCHDCHGPIWIDGSNTPRCRWCAASNLNFTCEKCGSHKLKQGGGGATRTVAEIGKSFPGAQIIESNGDQPILEIKPGKRIVVSTPGAEPRVEGGYDCVVILDASFALAKDSLRAGDIAVRNWSNAIALLAEAGRAVISGVPQALGQHLALWQHRDIAKAELRNRQELEFPPFLRLASVQGEKSVVSQVISKLDKNEFQILGPISLKSDRSDLDHRYVIKYQYSQGDRLAGELRAAIAQLSAGAVRTNANGRSSRTIRVRMDDPEVI